MSDRLEPCAQTDEDQLTWLDVAMRTGRKGATLWTRSLMQDKRDAEAMLIMVELRASRVAQVPTGEWCWFGHTSSALRALPPAGRLQ